jgi:hypothetical protein
MNLVLFAPPAPDQHAHQADDARRVEVFLEEEHDQLLANFSLEDRIAVLSFDYCPKFWLDFTGDRALPGAKSVVLIAGDASQGLGLRPWARGGSTQLAAQRPIAPSAGSSARPFSVSSYSTRTGTSGTTMRLTMLSASSSRRRSESMRSLISGIAARSSA